jgi:hypothetical protein
VEAGPSGRVLVFDLKRWRSGLQRNDEDVYIYELFIRGRNCTHHLAHVSFFFSVLGIFAERCLCVKSRM